MSIFKDKVLLITGGTGSFGNAVLRRFLDSDIREIRIFSRDEKKQDEDVYKRQLLYNYLFVHASECEIYRIKQRLPQYNLLPRVKDSKESYHYPYLTDKAMRDLQWIARSYACLLYTSCYHYFSAL